MDILKKPNKKNALKLYTEVQQCDGTAVSVIHSPEERLPEFFKKMGKKYFTEIKRVEEITNLHCKKKMLSGFEDYPESIAEYLDFAEHLIYNSKIRKKLKEELIEIVENVDLSGEAENYFEDKILREHLEIGHELVCGFENYFNFIIRESDLRYFNRSLTENYGITLYLSQGVNVRVIFSTDDPEENLLGQIAENLKHQYRVNVYTWDNILEINGERYYGYRVDQNKIISLNAILDKITIKRSNFNDSLKYLTSLNDEKLKNILIFITQFFTGKDYIFSPRSIRKISKITSNKGDSKIYGHYIKGLSGEWELSLNQLLSSIELLKKT